MKTTTKTIGLPVAHVGAGSPADGVVEEAIKAIEAATGPPPLRSTTSASRKMDPTN